MSQADFGAWAGVKRGSQLEYESGKRPFDANYLLRLIGNGVDSHFVLTGKRAAEGLSTEQTDMLNAFDAMSPPDQAAFLRLASSITGIPVQVVKVSLPSTSALTEAFGGVLEASPGLSVDELAHELATRLPIILRSAEDEIATLRMGSIDGSGGQSTDRDDDRRAAQL